MRDVNLAQALARLVKERKIWVYDNGILLNSQPSPTYGYAKEAIGYSRTSIAARRTIDTGKKLEDDTQFILLHNLLNFFKQKFSR